MNPRFRRTSATATRIAVDQLCALAASGIALGEAMRIAAEAGGAAREIFVRTAARVERGLPLSRALPRAGAILDACDIALIRAGEKSGDMNGALRLVADGLASRHDAKTKAIAAFAYPIALLTAALCVAAFLSVVALPTFAQMYVDGGRTIPSATRIALACGRLLTDYGAQTVAAAASVIWMLRFARKRSPAIRRVSDSISLRIPWIGRSARIRSHAELYGTMSRMVRAGVDLESAFALAVPVVANRAMRDLAERTAELVRRGLPPSTAIARSGFDTKGGSGAVLRIAEESGELGAGFQRASQAARTNHETRIAALLGVVQPVAILLLAVVVGGFVLALYQPMLGFPDMFAAEAR